MKKSGVALESFVEFVDGELSKSSWTLFPEIFATLLINASRSFPNASLSTGLTFSLVMMLLRWFSLIVMR